MFLFPGFRSLLFLEIEEKLVNNGEKSPAGQVGGYDLQLKEELVMCKWLAFVLLLTPSVVFAGDPKLVSDLWDVAYLQGSRAGYVHTFVQEHEKDGNRLLQATTQLRLMVTRSGQPIELGMDTGTFETPEGKVMGTFLKHFLGKSKTLEIAGIVNGGQLLLTIDKSKSLDPAPWKADVVGLARQQRLYQEHGLKPGESFTFESFEPSLNLVVKTKVQAKDFEDVEVLGSRQKKKLLRIESQPEKIQSVQLPTLITWLDDDLLPLRSEAEIPPFGRIVLYRTTKAIALNSSLPAKLTEIGTNQYVRLARKINNPYETTAALYRITFREVDDIASAFSQDDRQTLKKVQGKTIELQVSANFSKKGNEAAPSTEFTQNSYFITCGDPGVKTLARQAVGTEADPWKKSLRIEKWVHNNMTVASDEEMVPADHVARNLRGGCKEFAMLMAAMCRAQGIPSRTAVGLIYADVRTGPVFAFHMWTEVWVNGRWIPLDATLGKGRVGATHLKISDHSWHEIHDITPLLPVVRVLGQLSIEVVRTEGK